MLLLIGVFLAHDTDTFWFPLLFVIAAVVLLLLLPGLTAAAGGRCGVCFLPATCKVLWSHVRPVILTIFPGDFHHLLPIGFTLSFHKVPDGS